MTERENSILIRWYDLRPIIFISVKNCRKVNCQWRPAAWPYSRDSNTTSMMWCVKSSCKWVVQKPPSGGSAKLARLLRNPDFFFWIHPPSRWRDIHRKDKSPYLLTLVFICSVLQALCTGNFLLLQIRGSWAERAEPVRSWFTGQFSPKFFSLKNPFNKSILQV